MEKKEQDIFISIQKYAADKNVVEKQIEKGNDSRMIYPIAWISHQAKHTYKTKH